MDTQDISRVLVTKDPEGFLCLMRDGKPVPNAPRFKRFEAGVAWLDVKLQNQGAQNWLVVVGETESGSLHPQEEFGGPLDELAKEMVNVKDRYLIKRMYVDETNEESLRILKDPKEVDGLTQYGNKGEGPAKTTLWYHEPDYWPYYRDQYTKTALVPVPDDVRVDLLSEYELMRKLSAEDKIRYRDHAMPVLALIMNTRPPLEDVLMQPLCKAFLWCVTMMRKTMDHGDTKRSPVKPWYPNMGR